MTSESVAGDLQVFASRNSARIITESEFQLELERILEQLRLVGLAVQVRVTTTTGELAKYGQSREETFTTDTDSLGQLGYQIIAGYNRHATAFDANAVKQLFYTVRPGLTATLKSFWGTRDGLTLLYRNTETNNLQRLNATLADAADNQQVISVVHLDLDHFKKVNSEFGEPGGDAVLAEFGRRIRRHFGEIGLLLRKGGEEFSIFLLGVGLERTLDLADSFRMVMESESFATICRPNTCSIGISLFPQHYPTLKTEKQNWFDYLLGPTLAAEERSKSLGRNCLSLPPVGIAARVQELDWHNSLLLVAVASRVGWFSEENALQNGFESAVVQILSRKLLGSDLGSAVEEIAQTKREFGIVIDERADPSLWTTAPAAPTIHPIIWLAIVLSAFLKASFDGRGPLKASDGLLLSIDHATPSGGSKLALCVRSGSSREKLLEIQLTSSLSEEEIDAGRVWIDIGVDSSGIRRTRLGSFSPVLLLVIGQLDLPRFAVSAAAGVVEVDDRPVIGGGLPDFWQSNLSRLVNLTVNNPNVAYVVVVGDISKAEKTVYSLQNTDTWDLAGMTRRLGLDLTAIETYKRRKVRVLVVANDANSLVGEFYQSYLAGHSAELGAGRKQHAVARLTVTIKQEPLTIQDGIRCATAAEAYPKIISVIRSLSEPRYVDHLKREFVELASFKLVLDQPFEDQTPDYWLEDQIELKTYFEKQFGKQGLFGRKMYSWGDKEQKDQVSFALKETVAAIKARTPTRRLIMVIAEPSDDLGSPLGLVAVHILPRFVGGRWQVSFNWVWRTVEALVGLPFSLYGSIEFSREFLNLVNEQLRSLVSIQASMGSLAYVALSLHMFTGEGDQQIARAIVTGAM